MYLHLGQDIIVNERDIVGVFDLDNSTISRHTREFLSKAQKEGRVVNVSMELPKSFIVCEKKRPKDRLYFSDLHCHPAAAGFRQAALGGRGDLVPFSERLVLLCSISEFPAALIAKSGSI